MLLKCIKQAGVALIVFSRRATDFRRWAKLLEMNFFIRIEISCRWLNQAAKIMLTAGQFGWYPAPNEIPEKVY